MPRILFNLMFLFIISTGGWAAEGTRSPPAIAGVTTVTAEQFVALAAEIPHIIIVDARMGNDRKNGYIEGSVSLPDVDTDCRSLAKILLALDTPVAFYCNGIKCGRSGNAATKALACGYRSIYWFRGGFEEWRDKGFPYITE